MPVMAIAYFLPIAVPYSSTSSGRLRPCSLSGALVAVAIAGGSSGSWAALGA